MASQDGIERSELWPSYYEPGFVAPFEGNPSYVPYDKRDQVIGLCSACIVVSFIFVAARLYTRAFLQRIFKVADWTMLIAWMVTAGYYSIIVLGVKMGGLGKHAYDCTTPEIVFFQKFAYMTSIMFPASLFFARGSIIFLFIRLAGIAEIRTRRTLIGLQVLNLANTILMMFPLLFFCVPEMRVWDLYAIGKSGCSTPKKGAIMQQIDFASTIIGVVIDLLVLTLPVRMILRLPLPGRQRAAVVGLFGIGILTCVVALVKGYFVCKQAMDYSRHDMPYSGVTVYPLSMLELMMTMITGSLPLMKPLFKRFMRLSSSRSREHHTTSESNF